MVEPFKELKLIGPETLKVLSALLSDIAILVYYFNSTFKK